MAILGIVIIVAYCIAATLLVYTFSPSKLALLSAAFLIWLSGGVAALVVGFGRSSTEADMPSSEPRVPATEAERPSASVASQGLQAS